MKPLIAVTTWKRNLPTFWDARTSLYTLAEDYVRVLRQAGAVPLLLAHGDAPDLERILDAVDAVVVTGGGDIHPGAYGSRNDGLSRDIDTNADDTELAIVAAARQRRLPTLGICRGLQVINVALGGTLRQHIWTDDGPHRPTPRDFDAVKTHGHTIRLEPGTRLAAVFARRERRVNSYHHQAVETVAPGLRVAALAADGVIEALEHSGDDWDCLAVQWHPEKTADGSDDVLFEAFVSGAAEAASALSRP